MLKFIWSYVINVIQWFEICQAQMVLRIQWDGGKQCGDMIFMKHPEGSQMIRENPRCLLPKRHLTPNCASLRNENCVKYIKHLSGSLETQKHPCKHLLHYNCYYFVFYFPLQEGLCYDKISPDAKVMQLKGFSDFDPS